MVEVIFSVLQGPQTLEGSLTFCKQQTLLFPRDLCRLDQLVKDLEIRRPSDVARQVQRVSGQDSGYKFYFVSHCNHLAPYPPRDLFSSFQGIGLSAKPALSDQQCPLYSCL